MNVEKVLHKPIIGILGGIGSGKSSVSRALAKLGCAVIDADHLAHTLLDDPAIQNDILNTFGPSIRSTRGSIDRSALGSVVFNDPDALTRLNRILHPPVLAQTESLIAQYQQNPGIKAIVLDMPLLVEVGWAERCDHILFVDCSPEKRRQRNIKKGIYSEQQWEKRENFQISLDSKRQLADTTLSNNSGFSALVKQVAKFFTEVVHVES